MIRVETIYHNLFCLTVFKEICGERK